jgi:hypothetical protein
VRGIFASWMLVSAIGAPCALGQKPSRAVPVAASSGLVLGYVSGQHHLEWSEIPSMVQYRTLFIVSDASGVRIVATLPDLIVPRKTGFWRLGIEHTCQVAPDDDRDHGNIETQDIAYAVPAERPPIVELKYPACDSDTAKRVANDSYIPCPSNPPSYNECGGLHLSFKSVLPDLISISAIELDLCLTRDGHNYAEKWVQNPDDPMAPFFETWHVDSIPSDTKIRFDHIFGPSWHNAWVRAVSPLQDAPGETCGDPSLMQQTGWNLEHGQGQWRTAAYVNVDGSCEGIGRPEISVPRSLTQAVPLPIPWSVLEEQLSGISDAYFSPAGSIVLAVQSAAGPASNESHVTSAALFDFSEGKIGRKLFDLPAGDVVMAEWVTGRSVKEWAESLSALQIRSLPAPVLKLKPQPN